jgi:DNA-binding transcriptional LysR family regulator
MAPSLHPVEGVRKCSKLQHGHATMQPMNWDDVQTFLAIARSGSFARAGHALGVNATTVGRRLATLEASLEVGLFRRTTAGLSLSDSGRLLLPRAERIEAELVAAQRQLRGADASLSGSVRISATDGVLQYLMIPAISQFRRQHPSLSIELRSNAQNVDLSRREADVAVRLSRPQEPTLVARAIGKLNFGLFASKGYLREAGTPRRLSDLGQHAFVSFDAGLQVAQARWLTRIVPNMKVAVALNTTVAQAAACSQGLGIALLPGFVTREHRELVQLLPRLACPIREVYCVSHEDMRGNARVTCVATWLRSLFELRENGWSGEVTAAS